MSHYPYPGYPPFFPPPMGRTGLTLDEIREAEKSLSELKKSFRDEEEKKKKRRLRLPKFDILQMTALLMIFGPVVGYTYYYFLTYLIQQVNILSNGVHP